MDALAGQRLGVVRHLMPADDLCDGVCGLLRRRLFVTIIGWQQRRCDCLKPVHRKGGNGAGNDARNHTPCHASRVGQELFAHDDVCPIGS